jgi:hypothetical protein
MDIRTIISLLFYVIQMYKVSLNSVRYKPTVEFINYLVYHLENFNTQRGMIMKELVFTAVGAFAAGCMARTSGFKLLDDANPGEFDTILFGNGGTPHSPCRYAALITSSSAILGGFIGAIATSSYFADQNNEAAQVKQMDACIVGFLVGATAGVCFSVGSKVMEYRKEPEPQINSTRRSSASALLA